jgi:hypothetical protein
MRHTLRTVRRCGAFVIAMSALATALVGTGSANAAIHEAHFCWGKTITPSEPCLGSVEGGEAYRLTGVYASGVEHSICVGHWLGKEKACSSGPGQGVFLNVTPSEYLDFGKIFSNTGVSGPTKVYGVIYWEDPLEGGGGSGGGGESPPPPPVQFIGFQSNGHTMWDYSSENGPFDTGSGMAAKTSPSVTYVPGTGYLMAFRGSDGNLWVYNRSANSWLNTNLGMASGTSPSIAASSDGTYRVAFQANSGVLWYYSSAAKAGFSTGGGMTAGTNPSLTWGPNIGYVAAFQATDHNLWTYSLGNGVLSSSNLGMTTGTSPSIVANTSNSYVIGIQASDHNLWTYTSGHVATNRNLGMAAGTSPSLASQNDYSGDGNWIAAFQANSGAMWYYTSNISAGINTGSGMYAGSNPSADYLSGEYILAFEANDTTLWTFKTATGSWFNSSLGMDAGTSPSIVIH